MAVTGITQDIVTLKRECHGWSFKCRRQSRHWFGDYRYRSSIDESKAAAVILHRLLGIQPLCPEQANQGSLLQGHSQFTTGKRLCPPPSRRKALVIAWDIARYGLVICRSWLGEPAERYVCMLVTENPRIMTLSDESVFNSRHLWFWQPTGKLILMDGPLSNATYIDSFLRFAKNTNRYNNHGKISPLCFIFLIQKWRKSPLLRCIVKQSAASETDEAVALNNLGPLQRRHHLQSPGGNLYTNSLCTLTLTSLLKIINTASRWVDVTISGSFSYGSAAWQNSLLEHWYGFGRTFTSFGLSIKNCWQSVMRLTTLILWVWRTIHERINQMKISNKIQTRRLIAFITRSRRASLSGKALQLWLGWAGAFLYSVINFANCFFVGMAVCAPFSSRLKATVNRLFHSCLKSTSWSSPAAKRCH